MPRDIIVNVPQNIVNFIAVLATMINSDINNSYAQLAHELFQTKKAIAI